MIHNKIANVLLAAGVAVAGVAQVFPHLMPYCLFASGVIVGASFISYVSRAPSVNKLVIDTHALIRSDATSFKEDAWQSMYWQKAIDIDLGSKHGHNPIIRLDDLIDQNIRGDAVNAGKPRKKSNRKDSVFQNFAC